MRKRNIEVAYFVPQELAGKFPVVDVLSEALELFVAPLSLGDIECQVGDVDLLLHSGVHQGELGIVQVNVRSDLVPVQLGAGAHSRLGGKGNAKGDPLIP